ncbi:sensory box histidine kinase PhoR [soil metagenome]
MRSQPLRVKLVVIIMVLVAIALTLTGVAASLLLKQYLLRDIDRAITRNSQAFTRSDGFVERQAPPGASNDGPRLPSQSFVRLTVPGGASEDLKDFRKTAAQLPELQTLTAAYVAKHDDPFTVDSVDGKTQWRVQLAERPDGTFVAVAQELGAIGATTSNLVKIEVAVGIAVALLLGVVSYLVVRSSLRPLQEVEETAEAIAAGDLSRRVPESDPRTEVGGLAVALNTMLGQIESSAIAREEAARDAAESEERMRRFVADASHELRTPLTSIQGFAELYAQGGAPDTATVDRFMQRIQSEGLRMGGLVEDLLMLARLDQHPELQREEVDLHQLAEDAVLDARAIDPQRPIVHSASSPEVRVLGDESRLRQVLANLLRNALVHTPKGTPISVEVGLEGSTAVIKVRDKGPGIAPADAERIFERFYRADTARTRNSGGNGLGLSIVAGQVEAHGGTVAVESEPSKGATFIVRLPTTP